MFTQISTNECISFIPVLMKLCCAMKFSTECYVQIRSLYEEKFSETLLFILCVIYTQNVRVRNKFSDKYHFLSHEKFQKLDIDYQCHMNDNALIKIITIYTS